MNLRSMFDLGDLNWWVVFGGIGSSVILVAAVAFGAASLLRGGEQNVGISQVVLLVGTFLATFVAALITGRIGQGNYVTYGLVSTIGSVVVVLFAMPIGIFTILMIAIAVAGGLNGGMVNQRRQHRRRR